MPRKAALETLLHVERGALAKEALDRHLRGRKLESRDRDLARELVQGTLRHLETLDHILGHFVKKPLENAHPVARNALRLGAHQIVLLDRIPPHAAVHSSVELVKTGGQPRAAGFVNAVLRKLAGAVEERGASDGPPDRTVATGDGGTTVFSQAIFTSPDEDRIAYLSETTSHPAWLVERFLEQHGDEGLAGILAAGSSRPLLSLRPRDGTAAESLTAALTESGATVTPEGRCLLVEGAGRITELPGWDDGAFAVQDPTAADTVPAADPQPGESVLELCAAPGGKTVALAEAVGPDGLVMAVDLPGPRLKLLEREVKRRGLTQVAVLGADAIDPANLPQGVKGRDKPGFDLVLVDVPCSNTGVFSRRVEARRRLEGPDRIAMLAEQAAHLLLVAGSRVREGGRLAYATCSIDRVENHDVVHGFLDEDPDFQLRSEVLTLPVAGRRGGGYVAVLERTGAPLS